MTYIFNAYFNFEENDNLDNFKTELEELYKKYETIRLVIDLGKKEISMSHLPLFKKFKVIFEDDQLGVNNLLETIVICKEGFKRSIVKTFLNIPGFKPKRPVRFFP